MVTEQMECIRVFSILDKKKLFAILNVLDESVVKDQFHSLKIKSLEEIGLTNEQALDIIECFFNFYLGLRDPDKIRAIINQTDVKEDTRDLVLEAFDEVIKKSDKTKVDLAYKSGDLENFGHEHLEHLEVTPEFRPILVQGKLQKMITSIIVEGHTHDTNHTKTTPINFQISLAKFEALILELNQQLQTIKTEVLILEEKLGGDIVSV